MFEIQFCQTKTKTGTGKSSILLARQGLYEPSDVGVLNNKVEPNFPLQPLMDKYDWYVMLMYDVHVCVCNVLILGEIILFCNMCRRGCIWIFFSFLNRFAFDVDERFGLDQTVWQEIVSGGLVNIHRKNKVSNHSQNSPFRLSFSLSLSFCFVVGRIASQMEGES